MRVYIQITNIDPLVVYIYPEGLARFATEKYQQPDNNNIANSRMHLTNFALNAAENKQIRILDGGIPSKISLTSILHVLSGHSEYFEGEVAQLTPRERQKHL